MDERAVLIDASMGLRAEASFYDALAAAAAGQIERRSTLVVHSGAGALVPSILRAAGGRVHAAIFVDALLPHPGRSWFDTAPAALAERLRREAVDGRAPPWPDWLPAGLLERLLPDRRMRETLIGGAPSVPLAFLDEPAPDGPASTRPGYAYLQLSEAYDREAAQARASGWPVGRLEGHHLSIATSPSVVAAALVELAGELLQSEA